MSVRVSGKITLDGIPLKRTFIDIKAVFLRITNPSIQLTRTIAVVITNDHGDFATNIQVPSFIANFNNIKLTLGIHCHNAAVEVLEAGVIDRAVVVEKEITNGGTLNLGATDLGNHYDHFRILAQSIDVYDRVWRQFRPYNRTNRNAFPLKRKNTIESTFENNDFVQVTYPSATPGLTFVEPADPANNGLPLVHVTNDVRLFGTTFVEPSLIPHELGHIYHFAAVDLPTRILIETNYVGFILNKLPNPYHDTDVRTDSFVAFIEAIGIFSERFYFFSKLIEPNLNGVALRKAFWQDELTNQSLSSITGLQYISVGTVNNRNQVTSLLPKAKDVEGRVYGAIYVHFAKKIGLREVVGLVMDSQALTFDDFKAYVVSRGVAKWTNAINLVENAWFN